ncbi:hypothetical protein BGZ61DRAFT_457583 [Ilyonectria robusta]|uniref:uncharacterized protein n=1 Tax=Ilyonectria robusta TaxID=1079257 RepID=UPI001E8D1EB6|nr:uncharacterized protein BGZ61DRAFT_457583 [Ilyonectria robusta]KAH8677086.1 hypothetical protein BGZ61DRAFT_457583 [Ilyonectria robusta]
MTYTLLTSTACLNTPCAAGFGLCKCDPRCVSYVRSIRCGIGLMCIDAESLEQYTLVVTRPGVSTAIARGWQFANP